VACVQVAFINRPVSGDGDGGRVVGRGAPEVGKQPVGVIHGFRRWKLGGGPREEHSEGASERLDVIFDGAEATPDLSSDAAFASKVREWGT